MPTSFTKSDDLQGARFDGVNLRGSRFVESDLAEVTMRGVEVEGMDIDAPWLTSGRQTLVVNGVDVAGFVDAELNRRFSGREQRRAQDPVALRAAWSSVEAAWQSALERVEAMAPGVVDVSVDGEWSFAETLRHLVLATDAWLGRSVLGREQPFHPLGLIGPWAEEQGVDTSVFTTEQPSYADVLAARADHVAMVRDFLARVTPEELDEPRTNPWAPDYPESTRGCLHVILEEEWEHLRFALRDLDTIESPPARGSHSTNGANESVQDRG